MSAPKKISAIFANPVVEENKIDYLLATDEGKSKFFNMKGFSITNRDAFVTAIKSHPHTARHDKITDADAWGQKFVFVCDIQIPSGKTVCIKSVWQLSKGSSAPHLVTAYPHE